MDHHHHHHMHHTTSSDELNVTDFSTVSTTAATLLQAVVTTVMSGDVHAQHHQHVDDGTAHQVALNGNHGVGEDHMKMYFHLGVDAIILFKEWTTSTTQGIIFSVFGIIILSMIYEGIKFLREHLFKKYFTSLEYSSVSVLGDDGKPVTEVHKVVRNRMMSWPHILQTMLHVLQMILSYFLMLIFMTFNVWLCLGVVVGSGLGYFLFGWRKATIVDITEHCH